MTPEIIFTFYKEHFIPVYSDFVALALIKPEQVLIEESNILSHIAQYFNEDLTQNLQHDNIEKAKNHLTRVTIDLNKLVWAEVRWKVAPFAVRAKGRLCFNLAEDKVISLYTDFLKKGREARRFEMSHIGNDPLNTIKFYEEMNAIGFMLLDSLDYFKTSRVQRWIKLSGLKPFLLGVLVASGIAMAIFPSDLHKWFVKIWDNLLKYIGFTP